MDSSKFIRSKLKDGRRVQGLGFRVQGLGFWVQGLGFRVWGRGRCWSFGSPKANAGYWYGGCVGSMRACMV